MTEITVHLEGGFKQDAVQLEWTDKIYAYSDIDTDYSLGLAKSTPLTPQTQTAESKALIPEKGLSGPIQIAPDKDCSISVNISPENDLTITVSNEKKPIFRASQADANSPLAHSMSSNHKYNPRQVGRLSISTIYP